MSKATLRATVHGRDLSVGISGLAASLDVAKLLAGEGGVRVEKGGFGASLAARVAPLKLAAAAGLQHTPAEDGKPSMTALSLAVDLPATVPLASSGLGLFGIGGAFAAGGVPNHAANFGEGLPAEPPQDPILRQLYWRPRNADSFTPAAGQTTTGFEVVVGTFPDFGFSLSAKAGLIITFPELSLRFALSGKVRQPAVSMADPSYPPGKGVSFLGALMIDPDALTLP